MRHMVSRVVVICLVVCFTGFLPVLSYRQVGRAAEYTVDDVKSTFNAMNVILDEAIAEMKSTSPDCSKIRAYGAELKELTEQVEWLISVFEEPLWHWVDTFSNLDFQMGERPLGNIGPPESTWAGLENVKSIRESLSKWIEGRPITGFAYEKWVELREHITRFIEWLLKYQDVDELPQDFSWTYNSHWLVMSALKHQLMDAFPLIYGVTFSEWYSAVQLFRLCVKEIEWLGSESDKECAAMAGTSTGPLELVKNTKERLEILIK